MRPRAFVIGWSPARASKEANVMWPMLPSRSAGGQYVDRSSVSAGEGVCATRTRIPQSWAGFCGRTEPARIATAALSGEAIGCTSGNESCSRKARLNSMPPVGEVEGVRSLIARAESSTVLTAGSCLGFFVSLQSLRCAESGGGATAIAMSAVVTASERMASPRGWSGEFYTSAKGSIEPNFMAWSLESAGTASLDPVIDRHFNQDSHRASLDACGSKHGMQDVGARRLVECGIGSRDDLQRGRLRAAECVDDGLYRHASLQSGLPQRGRVLERRRGHDLRALIDRSLRVDLIGCRTVPIAVPPMRTSHIYLRHVALESPGVEPAELCRFP